MVEVMTAEEPRKKEKANSVYRSFVLRPDMHLHLVGIGGAGISAIAWVLLGRGFKVSGSDLQRNDLAERLAAAGATVYYGHDAAHIAGADALVISSAVPESNPELVAARATGIPVLKRSDFLGHLMAGNLGIAVAGSHGKTTTTSLIAHLLLETGRDPTVIVGGVLPSLGRNGRAGAGEPFVVEADEYDYMFLGLRPDIAVITNIEHDHPDMFPTPASYLEAFAQFARLVPDDGQLVVCAEDEGIQRLLSELIGDDTFVITYGIDPEDEGGKFDLAATSLQPNQIGGTDFVVLARDESLGVGRLRMPGVHNVRNALAAVAVGRALGISFNEIVPALASFGGVGRRFQQVGEVRDVVIIDDYAHHPTEIRATLSAARQRYPGRRLWAVWQPHTYSRTKLLQRDFASSFDEADRVVVLDIFRSREQDTLGMSAAHVVALMDHEGAVHIGARELAADYVLDRVRPGDVILTLGAGDGNEVGEWILRDLKQRWG